jgi:hypothetical protein
MKKFYFLAVLFFALAVSANAQPKFGAPTAFQKTINDLLSKIPINIAGNSIKLTLEGDTWRGQLNGQDLLAGVFKIDEGPDGAIITIKQSFLYADTGKKVPITNKPIAAWVDTPGPELFFEYKKGPPVSILPISQQAAVAALATFASGASAVSGAAAAVTSQAAAPVATATPVTPAVTAAATSAVTPASAVSPSATLNKVEVISYTSGWITHKDNKSSADIIINQQEQIDGQERNVLTIEVNNAPNGYAGAITSNANIVQRLQNANGVRFKVLGDGKQWRIWFPTRDVTDYCFHAIVFSTKKGTVTSVNIPFNRLRQADWGKMTKFNKNNIWAMEFQRGDDTGTGSAVIKIFDFEIIPEAAANAAAAPVANIPQGPSEHDMIVLVNGTILDAEVEEISPTQIKYRRADNLTGPVYVVNSYEVYSVKYKNGNMDIINATGRSPNSPILDPNKLYTGFSVEPSGFISGGPSATLEFTKGAFNTSFHASFPTLALNSTAKGFGFGAGASLNYYWGGPIGGFFLGGVFEWNMYPSSRTVNNPYGRYNPVTDSYSVASDRVETKAHNFIFALEGGYKFVLKNGIYFRTGIAAGVSMSQNTSMGFYYKPDLATGYIF